MTRDRDEALIYEALSQVETLEYDITAALDGARQAPRRSWTQPALRRAAVVAILCALLAVSAGAVGASGMWSAFFGPIPSNAVASVGVSQTAGDYTLTVQDAIVDKSGAILLLALERADGGDIDPNARLDARSMNVELLIDGVRPTSAGYSGFEEVQPSEDGKTLYFCYELSTSGLEDDFLGKTLTFTADGVGYRLIGANALEVDAPISLAALTTAPVCAGLNFAYHADIQRVLQAAEAQNISIPLPKAEEFPQYAVLGAVMTDNGLTLVVSQGMARSGNLCCTGVFCTALIDTRDGSRYGLKGFYSGDLSDGGWASLNFFEDNSLSAADLPYLELEVSYDLDRILSEEPFSLTFRPDATSALNVPVEEPMLVGDTELHPTEIRLSALSILVFFDDDMDTAGVLYQDGTAPVLILDDGTTLETQWSGGYGHQGNLCSIRFRTGGLTGMERFFFDTSRIVRIQFGSLDIPVPHT